MSEESNRENKISHFKNFYTTHLFALSNRLAAINDIKIAISIKEKNPGSTTFSRLLNTFIEKEIEIHNILKKHFKPSLLDLYKKRAEVKQTSSKKLLRSNPDESAIGAFFSAMGEVMNEEREQNKAQAAYELNILKYTLSCISNYGLHPSIAQREEQKYKKFNILIRHKAHSRIIIDDYILELSPVEFDKKFVQYYKQRKPILIKGKLIPHNKIVEVKITTSFLVGDEVKLFLLSRGYKILTTEENKRSFLFACLDETDRYLPHPDEEMVSKKQHDFQETQIAMINFPKSLALFNSALDKRLDENLSRNCLDDLRLCLETFIREKLKNKKSLENQVAALGQYLKNKDQNNQVSDLLHKVLDFYNRYQNENVKHNDNVKKSDVKFILKLTSNLIEHLSVI